MNGFNLEKHGLTVKDVRRNVAPARLYAEALREDPNSVIADSGALVSDLVAAIRTAGDAAE